MNYMWNEKYFFFIQRLYRDFPSQKDFLTVKCSVRILMTGQIGWSPDGLKDEQRDKRDQNPGEENGEFPGETDECGTNRAGHPTCKATHQTMIVPTVAKLSQGQNSAGEKTDQSWAGTECEDGKDLQMEVLR